MNVVLEGQAGLPARYEGPAMPSFSDGAAPSKLSNSLTYQVSNHVQKTTGNEANVASRLKKLNWQWISSSHIVKSIVDSD